MNKSDKHNVERFLNDAAELEQTARRELASGAKAQAVISLSMAHDNREAAAAIQRGEEPEWGGSSWTKYVPLYKHLDDPSPTLDEQLRDLDRRIRDRK